MIKTTINDKWQITLPKHRAERPEYHTPPYWEHNRLLKLESVIDKTSVVYYVGSEEAEMPALCQMWGARVALFEPNERVAGNAKAIWQANKLSEPLAYFPAFAGFNNTHQPQDVDIDINNLGDELISDHGFKELHEAGDTPIITIDEVSKYIKEPTIISIDTEGSEWEVLKGAEQTLRKYHPMLFVSIHPEFMFRIYGKYSGDLRRWIRDIGYREELLDFNHEMHAYYE